MPALGVGRVVAAAGHDRANRHHQRLTGAEPARQAHAALGDRGGPGIDQVGSDLEVPRVLARLAVDEPRRAEQTT